MENDIIRRIPIIVTGAPTPQVPQRNMPGCPSSSERQPAAPLRVAARIQPSSPSPLQATTSRPYLRRWNGCWLAASSHALLLVFLLFSGNDFSTIFAPLVRDGRMDKYYWQPTQEDLIGILHQASVRLL